MYFHINQWRSEGCIFGGKGVAMERMGEGRGLDEGATKVWSLGITTELTNDRVYSPLYDQR